MKCRTIFNLCIDWILIVYICMSRDSKLSKSYYLSYKIVGMQTSDPCWAQQWCRTCFLLVCAYQEHSLPVSCTTKARGKGGGDWQKSIHDQRMHKSAKWTNTLEIQVSQHEGVDAYHQNGVKESGSFSTNPLPRIRSPPPPVTTPLLFCSSFAWTGSR